MKLLTAKEVLLKSAKLHGDEGDDVEQLIVLWGLNTLYDELDKFPSLSKIGREHERFSFVDFDHHPILGSQAYQDHGLENGDIFGTLEALADPAHYFNKKEKVVPVEVCNYIPGTVLRFWGKDGEFYIMPIAGKMWGYPRHQTGPLFKRAKMAEVLVVRADSDAPQLTAFIGLQEEAIQFAKNLDPYLSACTQADLDSFGGLERLPDGSTPLVGNLGRLQVFVQNHTFS